ncbi:MAG: hypothetical protein ABI347_11250 [Nitrososphaera sp.]
MEEEVVVEAGSDEHIIKCSICGRGLIVKDTINNGVAFLSHLELDHGIRYIPQRMTKTKVRERNHQGGTRLSGADPDRMLL